MSVEKITSKIISDAEHLAETALCKAKEQSREILEQAEKKAAEILKKAEKDGASEKEKLITRRKAVADIDGRKLVLETKQQIISRCFDEAIEKTASMEKKEYIEFLTAFMEKTGETEGEIILNPKDRESVGAELIEMISEKIPGSKVSLSEETRNIKGGFLLKKGSVYVNGTIESLVNEVKEELIGRVADVLFE